ncbi:MAG: hypothetical protein U0Z70_03135 [Thermomicrobiales bacterium]
MRFHQNRFGPILVTIGLIAGSILLTGQAGSLAQSQEPKPSPPPVAIATPAPQSETRGPGTGITGNTWLGPSFGVGITWDPETWAVESEQIERGYDGLRLGTPAASVFLEAYEGFPSDPTSCLEDANAEIAGRDFVTEVVPLEHRPLPETGFTEGARRLFGIAATLEDGAVYRGVEYVECRQLPDGAMLELTWQVPVEAFNAELPLVNALFTNLVVPGAGPDLPELPASPPDLVPEM